MVMLACFIVGPRGIGTKRVIDSASTGLVGEGVQTHGLHAADRRSYSRPDRGRGVLVDLDCGNGPKGKPHWLLVLVSRPWYGQRFMSSLHTRAKAVSHTSPLWRRKRLENPNTCGARGQRSVTRA